MQHRMSLLNLKRVFQHLCHYSNSFRINHLWICISSHFPPLPSPPLSSPHSVVWSVKYERRLWSLNYPCCILGAVYDGRIHTPPRASNLCSRTMVSPSSQNAQAITQLAYEFKVRRLIIYSLEFLIKCILFKGFEQWWMGKTGTLEKPVGISQVKLVQVWNPKHRF